MKSTAWLVLLSLSLVACSGSKSAQKVTEETPQIELSDADEFIENPTDDQATAEATDTSLADEATDADAAAADMAAADSAEPDMAGVTEEPIVTDSAVVEEATPDLSTADAGTATPVVSMSDSGSMKQYTVQKNETLMMIAFKLYGDYSRWKDLASSNAEALKGSTALREGMTLNYMAPAEEFVWNPQGLPYLIRTGDTLGGISQTVYTTAKKWKLIWDNNRPLIKDPNKIYSGFTIYYLENGREVASGI
ncbi:LysM peptidoglycan-binding domain-containing protein [Peredibacter sp. HCB2-198]|uniref:LysM peptidoglycan-binding domain-containing protein n=1 Tax=Peredibacter sp. HCB2-198 TaxID=3383025 RepID=UPI0038B566DC